jgi:opine dehydrogenase
VIFVKKLPKIAVCGSGSAGAAIASDLSLMGCSVNLFELDKFRKKNVEPILERGGIEVTGETQSGKIGLAKFNIVTTDPEEAVKDTDLIMITVPAYAHEAFFNAITPHLREGQNILINTGYFASLRFAGMLKSRGVFEKITLAEANIMPYISVKQEATQVHIQRVKRHVSLSAFPAEKTGKVLELVKRVYPQHDSVPNVLWSNFAPGNTPVHATFAIPIASYYFDRNRGGKFYGEATTCGARLVQAFDKERLKIGGELGCQLETEEEWFEKTYGYKGKDLAEALRKSDHAEEWTTSAFIESVIREDIMYFYVPLVEFGQLLGIPTPTTNAIIEVMGIMLGINYRENGITLKDLGLLGMTRERIVDYVTTGK